MIVENTGGAGGTIGVTRAERSAPDGYTIEFGQVGNEMANGAIYSLDFDLVKDFEPIGAGRHSAVSDQCPQNHAGE